MTKTLPKLFPRVCLFVVKLAAQLARFLQTHLTNYFEYFLVFSTRFYCSNVWANTSKSNMCKLKAFKTSLFELRPVHANMITLHQF